jgi:hypothetical protein
VSARPEAVTATANGGTPPDAELAAKAAFVEHFRAGWAGGADTLLERFLPDLLDPDVVMTQPLLPPARGHAGFAAFFDTLFGAIPDLRGEVLDWRPTADGVEIDFVLRGTLGGAPLELPTTDRIVLREGRLLERHAKTEVRALAAMIARHPLASLPLLTAPLAQAVLGGAAAAGRPPFERALAGLALGRIALGAEPPRAARHGTRIRLRPHRQPELDYMTPVFGIRAIALGLGWLSTDGAARRRWQRLAFMCASPTRSRASATFAAEISRAPKRSPPPRSSAATRSSARCAWRAT